MRDAAVWVEIQQEFIATGVKYPELAAKFGVPLSTIKKKAAEFKWQEKRRAAVEADPETFMEPEPVKVPVPDVRVLDRISDKERFSRIVDEMLDRVEDAICAVDTADAASIKLLTGALKDLRDLKHLNRTELDIEEQKARIAKLKSDTRIVESEESGGVVFMPIMAERPQPPEEDAE